MTSIVVEGPDNAGKSTLIAHMARELGVSVVLGGGPGKSQEELDDRVRSHLTLDNVIFDRHPVVSQWAYNHFRDGYHIDKRLVAEFYQSDVLFVFCRGRPHVEQGHVVKDEVDYRKDLNGVSHIDTVNQNYTAICKVYDEWAVKWAHINYRIGDGYGLVTRLVGEAMRQRFNPIGDIEDFHKQFGLFYEGPPRILPQELLDFRTKFLNEETEEFFRASSDAILGLIVDGDKPDEADYARNLELSFDAMIDLAYVLFGTVHLQGLGRQFAEGWRRVHRANMSKVRATNADQSTRKSLFDVVKPKEWVAPSHIDIVELNDVTLKSRNLSASQS